MKLIFTNDKNTISYIKEIPLFHSLKSISHNNKRHDKIILTLEEFMSLFQEDVSLIIKTKKYFEKHIIPSFQKYPKAEISITFSRD